MRGVGRLSRAATERVHDFGTDNFVRRTADAYRELGVPAPSGQASQAMTESAAEPV